jgi:hypothetical protein
VTHRFRRQNFESKLRVPEPTEKLHWFGSLWRTRIGVLVRFDHVASVIVNANHDGM